MNRPVGILAPLVACLLAVVVTISGCGGEDSSVIAESGLDESYVGLEYPEGHVVLELDGEGDFLFRSAVPEGEEMRVRPVELAQGRWELSGGGLEVGGEGWATYFAPDSALVVAPVGSGTLRILRWVGSTAGSPFNACDLVSHTDLENLLRPPEGTGSEGG